MPLEALGKQRVLVTEDDPELRKLFVLALKRRRIDVETAANGEEAIRFLRDHEWLVLVLDLMMPVVSGFEVVSWLADHPERKPKTSLVVSAMNREALQQLDPTVVNAIIFKPFDIAILATYVKKACELEQHDRRRARLVGGDRGRDYPLDH